MTDALDGGAGDRINTMMDRLISVARRNEELAEAITIYDPTGGPGQEPAWKVGYRDRVSESRRVAWGRTLESALETWLADYE